MRAFKSGLPAGFDGLSERRDRIGSYASLEMRQPRLVHPPAIVPAARRSDRMSELNVFEFDVPIDIDERPGRVYMSDAALPSGGNKSHYSTFESGGSDSLSPFRPYQ